MTTISNLKQLEELIATAAFCSEPPLSERRAIHESGAWRWAAKSLCWCDDCREKTAAQRAIPVTDTLGLVKKISTTHDVAGHWEPAPFSTDPAASYALEQRMELWKGGWWTMQGTHGLTIGPGWNVGFAPFTGSVLSEWHESRLIAICLASLRAFGVEFTLTPGWDQR